jgi:hypothetical protein
MDRDVIGTCSPSIFVDVREEAVVGLLSGIQINVFSITLTRGSRRETVPTYNNKLVINNVRTMYCN